MKHLPGSSVEKFAGPARRCWRWLKWGGTRELNAPYLAAGQVVGDLNGDDLGRRSNLAPAPMHPAAGGAWCSGTTPSYAGDMPACRGGHRACTA